MKEKEIVLEKDDFIVEYQTRYWANTESPNYKYFRYVLKRKIWIFKITIVASPWVSMRVGLSKTYNKFENLIKCLNSAKVY